jgi:WS/DGAT/MGAT family acyltransferase
MSDPEDTADIEYDEWMSDADAILWYIERDPLLRSTITAVVMLDQVPDRARFDESVANMAANIVRMRQRVIDEPGQMAAPRWVDAAGFDIGFHYQWVRLPGRRPGTGQAFDFARRIAERAFDRDRPLWDLTVIEGLPGRKAMVVLRFHHTIADGLGLVQMMQHMVQLGPEPVDSATPDPIVAAPVAPEVAPPLIPWRSMAQRITADARSGLSVGKASFDLARSFVARPLGTTKQVVGMTDSVYRLVKPATTPLSPLLSPRSMSRQFNTVQFPLDDVKRAYRATGTSLNDIFVTGVLTGVVDYHRALGHEVAEVRAHIPVSIRGGADANKATNQFVPTRLKLPLTEMEDHERLRTVHDILAKVKTEPALPHLTAITGAVGRLGPQAAVSIIGSMMKGVDVLISNVPGPQFPVWVAGSRVEALYGFGPLGGAAINVTLFSYDGMLDIGVNSDRAAVTEPDRLAVLIEKGLGRIAALGFE